MDAKKPAWRELHRETGRKCPKLFFKFITDEKGYQLDFTDLIALWRARSSVEDIQDYASATRTSIDPSDAGQLKVLLAKLSKSLIEGTNALRQTENDGKEALILSTTIKLPLPLQPLNWQFYLEPQNTADLGETILRPCLHEAAEGRKKIESLKSFIQAKDRVISKLLEKIKGSSLDLSLVFPQITGVRAKKGYVTLEEARKQIAGLREFDEEQWRKAFESDGPYSGFETDGLFNLVSGNEKCPKHTSEQHQEWYSKLPKMTATKSQAARIEAMRSSSPMLNDTDTEDDFETQRKKKVGGNRAAQAGTDPESEREDAKGKHERPKQIRKLSAESSNLPSSPPPILRTTSVESTKLVDDPDATESESDSDLGALPKTKPRLGGLGSAKKPKMQTELSKVETSSNYRSSSPLPEKPILTSPPSSPPIQPPFPQAQPGPRRPPQHRTESSSSGIRTAGRLGGLRKDSRQNDTAELEDQLIEEEGKPPSTQTTPSRRRLGGLGRTNTTSQAASPSRNGARTVDLVHVDDAQHSDASTASTESAVPTPEKLEDNKTEAVDLANDNDSIAAPTQHEPEPEPEPQLTKEQKQSQRREELKRKNLSGQSSSSFNAGPAGGLRKKRKF